MDKRTKNKFFYKNSFPLNSRIAITTGTPQGVGMHIAAKTLAHLGPQNHFQFLLWSCPQTAPMKVRKFKTKVFQSSQQALKEPFQKQTLLEIKSSQPPWAWVKEASLLCLKGESQALITGPIDKQSMKHNPYKAVSQTPLLQALSKTPDVFMAFMGKHFHVILLTDHCPLKKVHVQKSKLLTLLKLALSHRSLLDSKKRTKPLGLLGLNPHGGEGGLLGTEEKRWMQPLVQKHFSPQEVQGPLSPDHAFLKKNWEKYSFYIALYHDQGLIPFKTIHNHKGYVYALGLPFLRFGVDHGTGYGLKPAEISWDSFLQATQACLKIIKKQKKQT